MHDCMTGVLADQENTKVPKKQEKNQEKPLGPGKKEKSDQEKENSDQ